jgi:nucleoid DNA-binding protein
LTFENIVRELDQNIEEDITIVNFGKFNKVVKKAHESINPTTKEKIMVEEKQQIKFAPSPNFKKIMGQTPIKTTTKKVVKKIGE